MKKVLILGAYGYLGTSLSHYLVSKGFSVCRQGRGKLSQLILDIFNANDLILFLKKTKIDCIINLIAITDVEYCELNHDIALRVNALSVLTIRQAIDSLPEKMRPHLIHISTDQVYCGSGPHSEHQVSPINSYGQTKLAGEVYANSARSTILRVNFIGKSFIHTRKSLSDWIVESAKNRNPIVVYEDVKFSPLHIYTLCHLLALLIEAPIFGVFNLGSRSYIDKATFAYRLTDLLGLQNESFLRGSLGGDNKKVQRPLDMSLNIAKIEKELGLRLPEIDFEININAKEYWNE